MRGLRFKTGLAVITALSSGLFLVIDSAKGATGVMSLILLIVI